MNITLVSIDLDGSLADPVMRIAVVLWALVLAVPSVVVFARVASARHRVFAVVVAFALGCITSAAATRVIATLIYNVMLTNAGVSVGLFGGPMLPSAVLAAVIGPALGTFIRATWRSKAARVAR